MFKNSNCLFLLMKRFIGRHLRSFAGALGGLTLLVSSSCGTSGNGGVICNFPYMRNGTGCCLDQNGNGICDSDEGDNEGNNGGNNTWYIQIGRNATLTERGFVSFDISSIPSGKVIDEANLRLYQGEVVGTPYSSLGSLILDHLDYGDSLGNEDLNASPVSSNIGTLTSNATVEWKDLIVTNALKADISSGRSRSQYRLRFTTEATGADAWARFESADNYMSTGNRPQLVVKYH